MVRLIVTEKPSVARDIARVLGAKTRHGAHFEGNGLRVTWCLGHVAELVEPVEYDPSWKAWSVKTLPMLPATFKLRPVGRTLQHWRQLKDLLNAREVEEIVNACDAGREGELIFRYACELARARKPVLRMWLSSMTDAAIRQAWRALRPGADYDDLADAARSRSEADWLVGLNATRALTLFGRQSGAGSTLFSVGRVQTPTLAMIVDREEAIEAFVPEPFWQVYATFEVEGGSYEGRYHTREGADRLPDADAAEAVAADVDGRTGQVTRVEQKNVPVRPPLLFDLTGLQRLANRRFGLSAATTLAAAQALYETHKLITYPRTDSNYLSTDMEATLPDRLRAVAFGPFAALCAPLLANLPLPVSRRIVNDAEVSDHHAIIPTDRTPDLTKLSATEQKVLELIIRRFIAVFYPDAVFATTRIETRVEPHLFVTRGRVCVQLGWHEVEPPWQPARRRRGAASGAGGGDEAAGGGDDERPDPNEDDDERPLPAVREGEDADVSATRVHKGMTQPPRRYSEATLLGAMEHAGDDLEEEALKRAMKDSGLGTPATRAAIIEVLLQREYIRREGRNLLPLPRGRALIHALPGSDLRSAAMTGQWEARLARVARGEFARVAFMDEARALTTRLVHEILNNTAATGSFAELPAAIDATAEVLGVCPLCGTKVTAGRKAYSCEKGRACDFVIFAQIAKKKISPALVKVLLARRRSRRLKGFRSKAGKPFEAALVLTDAGKIEFDFNADATAAASPGEAADDDDTGGEGAPAAEAKPRRAAAANPDAAPRGRSARSAASPDHAGEGAAPARAPRRKAAAPAAAPAVEAAAPPVSDAIEAAPAQATGRRRRAAAPGAEPPAAEPAASAPPSDAGARRRAASKAAPATPVEPAPAPLPAPLPVRQAGQALMGRSGPVRCPSCGEGVVIAGHRSWGCSRFRAGCRFVLPFERDGRPLRDEEAIAQLGSPTPA